MRFKIFISNVQQRKDTDIIKVLTHLNLIDGERTKSATVDKLYSTHNLIPANPLIAEAMYLRGTIERMGTGTEDLANRCVAQGLKKPEFIQEADFRTTLYRSYTEENVVTEQVGKLLKIIDVSDNFSTNKLMEILQLRHRPTFLYTYIQPAIELGLIEQTIPDKPNSSLQKYRLTPLGLDIKNLGKHTNK